MQERRPVIVAGVSGLDPSDPTLLVATEVARMAGAELNLVHAYQLPPVLTFAPGLAAEFPADMPRYSEDLLAALTSAAHALPGGEEAHCRVVLGTPASALVGVAVQVRADLIIVGAARGSRLGRAMLGTTAQRVLRESRVPVLVARRPVMPPLQRVLLTSDLSPQSGEVHDTALRVVASYLGGARRARSLLVLGWMGVPAPLTTEAVKRGARTELANFLRARHAAGPPVELEVRSGIAADEIVAEAVEWDADLLVVGTHARGWGARLMLGSVAEAALRDAPCNVLAIPPVMAGPPAVREPGWHDEAHSEPAVAARA
jgi:nucleotide-binding universal stress UspA family protein